MELVRPKACRGTGWGGCIRRQLLPVGEERRLLSIGVASKVRRNLVVEDVLFFLYAVKLEGAVCAADSFCFLSPV